MKDRKGMKKAVLRWGIFVCLALLSGFNLSCGSDGADEGEGTAAGGTAGNQYLSLSPYGITLSEVSSTSEEQVYELTIKRPQNYATSDVKGRLTAWTEAELEAYNKSEKTGYTLLPSSYYTITNKEVTLKTGESQVKTEVKINPSNVFSAYRASKANYVIALRLESDEATIRERQDTYLIAIEINYPKIEFASSLATTVNAISDVTSAEISTLFTFKENGEAQGSLWDFSCELQVPENAAELVEAYNKLSKDTYELLPTDAYKLGTADFKTGDTQTAGIVSIIREKLGTKLYLLPLTLKEPDSDKVMLKDEQLTYLITGKMYNNPVISLVNGSYISMPDPTVMRAADGYFYMYATGSTWKSVPVFRSKNLVNWEAMGTAFNNTTYPKWEGGGSIWAPEIRYINGKYVLYISWAKWADGNASHIGVATSDSPTGPFVCEDELLIHSGDIGVANSIDQFYYEEDGVKYLFWGSFNGIYVTELTDDGLKLKYNDDGTLVRKDKVAGNAFEGVNIYKKNGYYYMFASINSCCDGANSKYKVVVGRSESLLGPYVSKNGKKMLDNSWELVLESNDEWRGPGHNSIIIQDDEGTDWMIYHSYQMKADRSDVIAGRFAMLDRLQWTDDGWPYIKDCVPSNSDLLPCFND